jgi:uncharacterized membrane protein
MGIGGIFARKMKPLVVLCGAFAVSAAVLMNFLPPFSGALAARIAMSVMLVFTASGHFVLTRGMVEMLPGFVPFRRQVVYGTGILEVAGAVGLLFPAWRVTTGWLLIALFVMMLPANVYAAVRHLDYQKATFDGPGLRYLWFRIPLQGLFIGWTYFAAIR